MKITISSLLLLVSISCCSQNYQLVWSDEFNYTGIPDTTKWDYEEGKIRNNEEQYYTKKRLKNARVENDVLIIEAHKEKYKSSKYTSASLITLNRQHFLYGRIEVRARLPFGRGTWPAIWMLGTNRNEVDWPECGEVDIMENVGYNPLKIHANIHTGAYNHVMGTNKGDSITIVNPWEGFHVYAIEWHEDRIDFFADSVKYFTFQNDGAKNNQTWPFDKPLYLILNLAIGGAWGGYKGIDDKLTQFSYYIDYVRVYKEVN